MVGMLRDENSGPKQRIQDVLGQKPKPKMLCNNYLFYKILLSNFVRLLFLTQAKKINTFIERKLDRKYIHMKYQFIIFIQFYATKSDITVVVVVFD